MMNIQVPLDEQLLAEINKASKPLGLDLAQIIREALLAWLRRREGERFEQEWVAALKRNPDEASRAEDWLEAQTWSDLCLCYEDLSEKVVLALNLEDAFSAL